MSLYILTMSDLEDGSPLDDVVGVYDTMEQGKARAEAILAQEITEGSFRRPPELAWLRTATAPHESWTMHDEKSGWAYARVEQHELNAG